MEPINTIVPAPLAISFGSSAWTALRVPSTLTSNIARQSAGSESATVSAPTAPPALATRTSHRSSDSASAPTAARSVTSSWCTCAEPPCAAIVCATSASRPDRRAVRITS